MTLFERMMEPCVAINAIKVPDGQGGFVIDYSAGPTFSAAIVNDTSIQARTGEAQGVTSTYTITTKKTNALEFHDIIQRVSDSAYFRITSNPNDKKSPEVSTIDIIQCTAEKWSI